MRSKTTRGPDISIIPGYTPSSGRSFLAPLFIQSTNSQSLWMLPLQFMQALIRYSLLWGLPRQSPFTKQGPAWEATVR